MQPTPLRLQQKIWTAFRTSKPAHTFRTRSQFTATTRTPARSTVSPWSTHTFRPRLYTTDRKPHIESQIKDAQRRIDSAIESRADAINPESSVLKQNETIIHTNPEASSIVYNAKQPGEAAATDALAKSRSSKDQLPSEASLRHSDLRHRFTHLMDTFQSQVFVASQRLNDLTGYSGIEALKRDIEAQEAQVQNARNKVKETRRDYSATVENRSKTQREVNDLLQRKHAWDPTDLERFTNLYRSDHANEQAEQKAHEQLGQAETEYEEASTKLAKSILARYHEEQIWSDKIRQMSTWGTWGLMGLNVLLFIFVQILLEPWRRRRLVRGFEDKVQEALKERQGDVPSESMSEEADKVVEDAVGIVAVAGEKAAEAIADALTGATSPSVQERQPSQATIEQAAERITTEELAQDGATAATAAAIAETVEKDGVPDMLHPPEKMSNGLRWQGLPATMFGKISNGFAHYEDHFSELFNEKALVLVSRRDITTSALEGAFAGAALMATLLWALGTSR